VLHTQDACALFMRLCVALGAQQTRSIMHVSVCLARDPAAVEASNKLRASKEEEAKANAAPAAASSSSSSSSSVASKKASKTKSSK
jgi:hypothetical protein